MVVESQTTFLELQGLCALIQLIGSDDIKIKHASCLALAKVGKSIDAQNAARDLGVLPHLAINLASNDVLVCSSAASAFAAISRNGFLLLILEKMQQDIVKTTVPEILLKHLAHESPTLISRESLAALASLCSNSSLILT